MRDALFGLRPRAWPPGTIKILLAAWLISEALFLAVVIKVFGFGGAILLTVGSSLLGIVMLRRIGLGAAQHLRGILAGGSAQDGVMLDGTVAALGALLLIMPGFVTDFIGLALASPSFRQQMLARIAPSGSARPRTRRQSSPDVIDLAPTDWIVVDRAEGR